LRQRWISIGPDEYEAQFQQHKQLGSQLQRENALAAQAWLTLRRSGQGQKRYEHVCADLANNIVPRMNFLIGRCEQIANTVQEIFVQINVHFGSFCEHCDSQERSADRSTLQDHIRPLEADPAWGVLVKYLLLQATSTIHRAVGGDCSSPSEFEASPRCLHDLTKALLRQQRHLAEMGSARTPKMIVDPNILVTYEEIVTHEGVWVCPDCGNPTKFPARGLT
jgi:ribosomal protein L37AE/L43A